MGADQVPGCHPVRRRLESCRPFHVWQSCFRAVAAFVALTASATGADEVSAVLSDHVLVLRPLAATAPDETHAALVVSREAFSNFEFGADFVTLAQLRKNSSPNTWEAAWAVFAYTDDSHFYYMAFKTNGWELGKVDPAYPGGQRFLADETTVPTPVGTPRRFHIRQQGATITVKLDGATLTTFTDTERPYLRGRIGFYTEDAKVAFDNVSGAIADDFENHRPMRLRDGDRIGSMWVVPYTGFGLAAVISLAAAERLP